MGVCVHQWHNRVSQEELRHLCAIDGNTLPTNRCALVILQIPKSAETVRPFAFVLTPMGSLEAHCVAHEVPKTLYENLLVKHATMNVGGGNDGLRNARALVLKCIHPRKDWARAGGWRMTVTGDEAIQFVWTAVGTGINDVRGAVTISVAMSANRIVSTDLLARGGKELSNVDVFDVDQAAAREGSG